MGGGCQEKTGKGPEMTGIREKGAALRFYRHPYTTHHNFAKTSIDPTH